jgi:hypothetical protein
VPGAVTERKPFVLRLPEELYEELAAWAEQELRSVNAQIEYVLREAVRRRRGRGERSTGREPKER